MSLEIFIYYRHLFQTSLIFLPCIMFTTLLPVFAMLRVLFKHKSRDKHSSTVLNKKIKERIRIPHHLYVWYATNDFFLPVTMIPVLPY